MRLLVRFPALCSTSKKLKTMKKSSAEFMKFRKSDIDLSELEKGFNLAIPPIYRSFVEVFDSIAGDIIKAESNHLETLSYFRYVDAKGNDLMFEGFMDVADSLMYRDNSDSWVENKVMPISSHSHGGAIVIGYSTENMDKLYFEYDQGLVLLENHIYSFIRNLNFVVLEDFPKASIFKNWGEDFWRVRPSGGGPR